MTCAIEKKKYDYMENVLNKINQKHISLDENYIKKNNAVLKEVLDDLTEKLKAQCKLFHTLFRTIYYGGSYYDGLKICDPEEYDLDILLVLPKIIETKVINSDKSGYVYLQATQFQKMSKRPEAVNYGGLEALMEEEHFSTDKLKSWFEKLMTKTLEQYLEKKIVIKVGNNELTCYIEKFSKTGPAFTLQLSYPLSEENNATINIDLVPCFVFTNDDWPAGNYRKNPNGEKRNTFFVVPKKPSDVNNLSQSIFRYWRLSFQDQERDLITGHKFKTLKPSCKLIKKIRDLHDHKKIASYYIKTIFLWEAEKHDEKFWQLPLSYVFMEMLKVYAESLKNHSIPYYWNKSFNLLENVNKATTTDFGNKIYNIIKSIDNNPYDSFVIAKYLITEDEIVTLKSEVDLGKKHLRNNINNLSLVSVDNNVTEIKSDILPASETQFNIISSTLKNITETEICIVIPSEQENNESLSQTVIKPKNSITIEENSQQRADDLLKSIKNETQYNIMMQLKNQNDLLISQNKILMQQNNTLTQRLDDLEKSIFKKLDEILECGKSKENSTIN